MSIYAIGDIQGCYDEFRRLLDKIAFDPGKDRLWLAGDLINRGPKSLQVARFVRSLEDSAITVLGNHDLHLLAVAFGKRKIGHKDTFRPLLKSDDAEELINWFRHLPLAHYDPDLDYLMVHAGLPPQWDLHQTLDCAQEVETTLQSDRVGEFLSHMYGDEPDLWREDLEGLDRLRFITNCLTRLRFCSKKGELEMKQKGKPGSQPRNIYPWFEVPKRRTRDTKVIFGHWSTLGYLNNKRLIALDTGCVWGGRLSAVQLDGKEGLTQVRCKESQKPGSD